MTLTVDAKFKRTIQGLTSLMALKVAAKFKRKIQGLSIGIKGSWWIQ